MKLIFILLFFFNARISQGQKTSMLQGSWNLLTISSIVSSSRDSLYYDIEKDSISIPVEDLKEAKKDGLDSIQTIDLFKNMYESLKGLRVVFINDSVRIEVKSTTGRGVFKIIGDQTLDINLVFDDGKQENLKYNFFLKGNLLEILITTDIGYDRFTLKKE